MQSVTQKSILGRAARSRHLDPRVVISVLLMGVATLGGSSVLHSARARTAVLVVTQPVPLGSVLTAQDLRTVEIGLSPGIAFVPASMRDQIIGKTVTVPLSEGLVLSPAAVGAAAPLPPGAVAMSVSLTADHAAAGTLTPGAHVGVIASVRTDTAAGAATVLFTGVDVLGVAQVDPASGGGLLVTLALSLEQARVFAAAHAAETIDLVLLPGGSK